MSVLYILLYILLGLPVLVLCFWEWNNYFKIVRHFPGPQTLPFIGNAHQMGKNSHEILYNLFDWWVEFGKKNYRLLVGPLPNIVVTEIKDMEYILTSNSMLEKSSIYDMLHPWLGRGLLTSYGKHWSKHRKMITPSFHFNILQDFHEVMNANSTKLIEILRNDASNENILDIQKFASCFTLDVICETAMGIKINAMDNPNSQVVQAFRDMCEDINIRAYNPLKRDNTLYKLSPDYAHYAKTLKILKDFTNEVIEKRIETMRNEKNEPVNEDSEFKRRKKAFLDNLLTATIDGKPLTKQEVFEEVSTFIFEGFDTTTSGVAFAVYMLSRHPEIQRKVFEEQKDVLMGELHRNATFQEISDMKYLDLVLKEVERLYPSVPVVARKADKDYNMNGKIVPKGTSLAIFLMALGYREETFENPYICNPERFEVDRTNKTSPYSYVPFSAGPRNCIGQKFALLELKTIVSKIVRTFEILPPLDELVSKDGSVQHYIGLPRKEAAARYTPHKYDPQLSAVLTLKSDNGVLVRFRERKA